MAHSLILQPTQTPNEVKHMPSELLGTKGVKHFEGSAVVHICGGIPVGISATSPTRTSKRIPYSLDKRIVLAVPRRQRMLTRQADALGQWP